MTVTMRWSSPAGVAACVLYPVSSGGSTWWCQGKLQQDRDILRERERKRERNREQKIRDTEI